MGVTYGDLRCIEPTRLYADLASAPLAPLPVDAETLAQCNRFTVPLRAWPGTGKVLLRAEDLDQLINLTNGSPTTDLQGPYDLVFFDDATGQRRKLKNLYPLRAKCVTPGYEKDPYSVYAVELADWRYFALQKMVAKAYNVLKAPGGEWIDETLNGASPWTWDELGEDLWDELDRDESWPGWPSDPDQPDFPEGTPNSWHFWQVPAIVAFDAVAARLGCALRWNPYTDVLDIVQLGAEDSAFDESVNALKQQDRRWDEYWFEPAKARTPETIRVLFRNLVCPATGEPWTANDQDFPDDDYFNQSEGNTVALVIDDLVANSNGAAQTSRAEERVADYARMVKNWWTRLHRHYRGLCGPGDTFLGSKCGTLTLEDTGAGVMTIIDSGDWPPIEWGKYLHGVAEVLTEARCVGNDIEETLATVFSPPFRVS